MHRNIRFVRGNVRLAILVALSIATVSGSSALAATTTVAQSSSRGRTTQGAAPGVEEPASSPKHGGAPTSEPTTPQAGNRCPGATLLPNRHDLAAVADATICLINRVRASRHIPALQANEALDSSALLHSQEMHAHRFFGHDSASGQTPREQVLASTYGKGASDVAAAQNVAWGSGREATPRAVVLSWMASPPHRALLLSGEYHEVGVGAILGSPRGSRSGALYTADLARRHLVQSTGHGPLPHRHVGH